jgi:SAM-dependent methyltransferase
VRWLAGPFYAVEVTVYNRLVRRIVSGLGIALFACGALVRAASQTGSTPDIHYVPTPSEVVDAMLQVAMVTSSDVVYDLGSGDGRIVIEAARRFGARGVGIEIDPELVKRAEAGARKAGVADRVTFTRADLFKTDLSNATVVTLYLSPSINLRLRSKLQQLRPGTRIVSHRFPIGDWAPDRDLMVGRNRIMFWTVR